MLNCNIEKIKLTDFRNITSKELNFEGSQILITGQNGAGKTSILEAISLLSPGRGIRSEKPNYLNRIGTSSYMIQYHLNSYLGNVIIDQFSDPTSGKKVISMNARTISQNELTNMCNIFWLTPQQNKLFQEGASDRRKFYDRIVYSFFPEHASHLTQYETNQRERFKLLLEGTYDPSWVDIIEQKMSSLALTITKNRLEVASKLNKLIQVLDTDFPKIHIKIKGDLELVYEKNPEEAEDIFQGFFKKYREDDARTHRSHFGALKSDFMPIYLPKNIDASYCSTGEQQSSLITIIIAHTELFLREAQKKPILLLDELFVHLDEKNKQLLSSFLKAKEIQTFVTSTEKELCSDYYKDANVIEI